MRALHIPIKTQFIDGFFFIGLLVTLVMLWLTGIGLFWQLIGMLIITLAVHHYAYPSKVTQLVYQGQHLWFIGQELQSLQAAELRQGHILFCGLIMLEFVGENNRRVVVLLTKWSIFSADYCRVRRLLMTGAW